jgi:Zn finger protein HypA/HybF involved in hydrogenase expression
MSRQKEFLIDDLKNQILEEWNNETCEVCGYIDGYAECEVQTPEGHESVTLCENCHSRSVHIAKFSNKLIIHSTIMLRKKGE